MEALKVYYSLCSIFTFQIWRAAHDCVMCDQERLLIKKPRFSIGLKKSSFRRNLLFLWEFHWGRRCQLCCWWRRATVAAGYRPRCKGVRAAPDRKSTCPARCPRREPWSRHFLPARCPEAPSSDPTTLWAVCCRWTDSLRSNDCQVKTLEIFFSPLELWLFSDSFSFVKLRTSLELGNFGNSELSNLVTFAMLKSKNFDARDHGNLETKEFGNFYTFATWHSHFFFFFLYRGYRIVYLYFQVGSFFRDLCESLNFLPIGLKWTALDGSDAVAWGSRYLP